ncbi:hypothetical protein [uncultured Tateyamaria sp.]|nr:hypothetical protein [uncultured Tateyamaria sp.]
MELSILPILFGLTAAAVLVWALMSKRATENRMEDPDAPKSTLAEDAPNR